MKYKIEYSWKTDATYLVLSYLSYTYEKDLMSVLNKNRYDHDAIDQLTQLYQIIDTHVDKKGKDYERLFKPLVKEDINNDITLIEMVLMERNQYRPGVYKLFAAIWDESFESNEDLITYVNDHDELGFELKYNILNAIQNHEEIYQQALQFIEDVLIHQEKILELASKVIEYTKTVLNDEYINEMFEYLNIDLSEYENFFVEINLVRLQSIQIMGGTDPVLISWGAFAHRSFNYQATMDELEENFLDASKYLSDPTKLEIIKYCLHEERYAKEIAEHLNLSGATVSHHMNMLTGNNYVTIRLEKRRTYYRTNTSRILDDFSYIEKLFRENPQNKD